MPLVGIGTLPTPLSPASVPLPPETGGRWHTSLRVGGWGGVPIPTRGIHYGTLYMYVLCACGPCNADWRQSSCQRSSDRKLPIVLQLQRGFATPVALILRRKFVTSSPSTKICFTCGEKWPGNGNNGADKLLIYKYFLICWALTHPHAFTVRDKLLIDLARKSQWENNAKLQWWNVMWCNFTIYYLTMLSKICLSWHKKATFIR